MSDTQLDELERTILEVLSERGRISVTDLATDLDSTSQAIQIPLDQLKEDNRITIAGDDVVLTMSAKDRKDLIGSTRSSTRGSESRSLLYERSGNGNSFESITQPSTTTCGSVVELGSGPRSKQTG